MNRKTTQVLLADLGTIVTGKTPSTKNPDNFGVGIPFVTPSDMDGRRVISHTGRNLTSIGANAVSKTRLPPLTVMVSCIGSDMGKVALAGKECVTNQQINSIIVSEKVEPMFVYYNLLTRKAELQMMAAGGSAQPILNKGHFSKIPITLPPLPEQKAIAHILGTLDDKIELNRKMNETLEEMARAIFKSWFVDFDPVRAKMDGRQPVGMDAETAALFPCEFEDLKLGKIPKGWEVRVFSDLFDVNPKRVLRKGTLAPYLDMKNMPKRGHRLVDFYLREFGSGTKFENGDTLFARITPCTEHGKTAFVDFLEQGETGWGSTEYIVIRAKPNLPAHLSYYYARDNDFRANAITNMTGSSGRQRVPNDCINRYEIAVPTNASLFDAFGQITSPIMELIKSRDEESHTLAHLRDTLLPKLLSGELRVPEAEKLLEKAA